MMGVSVMLRIKASPTPIAEYTPAIRIGAMSVARKDMKPIMVVREVKRHGINTLRMVWVRASP